MSSIPLPFSFPVMDGPQEADCPNGIDLSGIDRLVETDADVGLRAEAVNLMWFDLSK